MRLDETDLGAEPFGDYLLERELGRGGQGVVYLSRHRPSGERRALKVLSVGRWSDPGIAERLRRELAATERLRHPSICRVYEVGEVHGSPFVAMEYVEGLTLSEVLPQQGMRARVELVAQLARAVDVAHQAGVVHRDLKPANVMVVGRERPVVLDFGIASLAQSSDAAWSRSTHSALGTLAYMAPEQLDPHVGRIGPATDVWALGVILHEALLAARPFRGVTAEALQRAILEDELDLTRSSGAPLPPGLALVLDLALSKEPWLRYANAGELADDLERFLAGEPLRARRTRVGRRMLRWARRHRGAATALIGLVIALAASLVTTGVLLAQTQDSLAASRRHKDARSLPYLLEVAEHRLWPVLPAKVAEMDAWISETRELLGRRALDERGEIQLAATLVDVEARRARADSIERETLAAFHAQWERARADIADTGASPWYAGLALAPQVGLVPLGRDPASGFHEFAHLQSGAIPARDPATGLLQVDADSALVLVLLPGGRFRMGAERPSPGRPLGAPNVDPQAFEHEAPVHEVTLEPFFLSKYELTQGQWLRLDGQNPSSWRPEHSTDTGDEITLACPVAGVSWALCAELVGHYGLLLPTEAQWEYAARAGTSTVGWTGDDLASLAGAANVADLTASRTSSYARSAAGRPESQAEFFAQFDDGVATIAAVGRYRPNAFGLHDVLGNVTELVRDGYGPYTLTVRPGDGLRYTAEQELRVARGGQGFFGRERPRSAERYPMAPEARLSGVRPSRAIDR